MTVVTAGAEDSNGLFARSGVLRRLARENPGHDT